MVGPPGLEPGTKGFWFVLISQLPGLCLHHMLATLRWVPSSLYTFKVKNQLSLARHCHILN